MVDAGVPPVRRARSPMTALGGAVLVGALVAVAAGVYGRVHDPASETTIRWFFTSTRHFKAWMTTLALLLAILQLLGARTVLAGD